MQLPINIEDLLSARTVESDRIEFKEGWNPDAIYRSICAFANDFDNTGGGYILIGVEEEKGTAKRPVKGLKSSEIADIQRKMIGLNNLINPVYHAKLSIETVDKKQIIALWIPGGPNRPYEVPEQITANNKRNFYYIRKYANSVKANSAERQELISLANQVPFDDRVNSQASVNDISMLLVQDHLRKTGSKLADEIGKSPNEDILKQMELISGPKEHSLPRNVALMLFSEHPEKFFPYTQVEVIHFPEGPAGKEFNEKIFKGPVQLQITQVLNYIKSSFLVEKVNKITGRAESTRVWNYPYAALEEAVANCLYHRNYQEREPVKIRIEPDMIIIYNTGGPDRSIRKEDFAKGKVIPKRYRNRRLGDFLKELELTEGHATGLPSIRKVMKANGSPEPSFDFDEDRTWFEVILPIHPAFKTKPAPKIEKRGGEISKDLELINTKLEKLLKKSGYRAGDRVGDRAGDRVGDRAGDQAGAIVKKAGKEGIKELAASVQGGLNKKMELVLLFCKIEKTRREIFGKIKLAYHLKNYKAYVEPLLALGWLELTIADKPSSPKQKYRTTLKGRMLIQVINNDFA